MPETVSPTQPAQSTQPPQPAPAVRPAKKPSGLKIVNNERRPLMFRIIGKTIRLDPGEMVELPGEHHAAAPELRALSAKGAVQILRTHSTETAETAAPEAASGKPAADKTASEKADKSSAKAKPGS